MPETKRYAFSWKYMMNQSRDLHYIILASVVILVVLMSALHETVSVRFLLPIGGLLILIPIGIVYMRYRHMVQVFEKSVIVPAEITNIVVYSEGPYIAVQYRYIYGNLDCESFCYVSQDWLKTGGRLGDTVDVIVNPDKPIEAYIADAYGDLVDEDSLIAAKLTPTERKDTPQQER